MGSWINYTFLVEDDITDASKCYAYGDGLSKAVVGEVASFNVDTSVIPLHLKLIYEVVF